MSRAKTIVHVLLYCFALTVIYLRLSHLKTTQTMLIDSVKGTSPLKTVCHLSDGTAYRRDHLRPFRSSRMAASSAYVTANDSSTLTYITRNFTNFTEFLEHARVAVMARRLIKSTHSIQTIFRDPPHHDMVKPSCDGLWLEFGVFRGNSLKHIADWKSLYCGDESQPVYGFDTFTGLPTNWRSGFDRGSFGISNGTNILLPSNTVLVKGLFIDTLPNQLLRFDQEHHCHTPVSFVHIDCDIYEGTRDVLFLLGSRFVHGTILIFDELFNYPGYEKHEFRALFEFLAGSNLWLLPVGSSVYLQRHPVRDINIQSFAFVVNLE